MYKNETCLNSTKSCPSTKHVDKYDNREKKVYSNHDHSQHFSNVISRLVLRKKVPCMRETASKLRNKATHFNFQRTVDSNCNFLMEQIPFFFQIKVKIYFKRKAKVDVTVWLLLFLFVLGSFFHFTTELIMANSNGKLKWNQSFRCIFFSSTSSFLLQLVSSLCHSLLGFFMVNHFTAWCHHHHAHCHKHVSPLFTFFLLYFCINLNLPNWR